MKMKRLLALVPAAVLALGTCTAVFAADTVSGNGISVSGNSVVSSGSNDEASGAVYNEPVYDRVAEAFALAIRATGIPQEDWFAAEEQGKTIGEYLSNSVMEIPGLDTVVPVGQGGKVIIDGQASNVCLSVQKPLPAHVDSAKSQAAAIGGSVLNVVNPKTTTAFGTATVNFYMPGVMAGQNIQVYRYDNGQWASVNVTEVREDHVVANLTAPGVLAFIQVQ